MRKVLLATTALVAMGGVSAASADISVSGGHELKYQTWGAAAGAADNSNSISSSTSYKISASSVADNGMSMTGYTAQDGSGGNFDDYGFTISDDWGTIGVKVLSPAISSRPTPTSPTTKATTAQPPLWTTTQLIRQFPVRTYPTCHLT